MITSELDLMMSYLILNSLSERKKLDFSGFDVLCIAIVGSSHGWSTEDLIRLGWRPVWARVGRTQRES